MTGDLPAYKSLRVGWVPGEWVHEYLLTDIVGDLERCIEGIHHLRRLGIQRDILPRAAYDRVYGTRENYRSMMDVYADLADHLDELWLHVAHTGSLRKAVHAMYAKHLPDQGPDVDWDLVVTYPAMKGMLIPGHPDP